MPDSSGLLGTLGIQILLNRKLVFQPLEKVRAKAVEISSDDRHLGEEIGLPSGRELTDLSVTNENLRQALAEIRTLSGLIPICASCKKIRDDQGSWRPIEAYIAEHSDASFTHGLCPECQREFFSGVAGDRGPRPGAPPE